MTTETAVRKALALAIPIRDYFENELPKIYPNYPFMESDTDPEPVAPGEKKLRQFLTRLGEDTLHKLALVMYLGRGDVNARNPVGSYLEKLKRKYQELREDFKNPSEIVFFLLENAVVLPDYLEDGLAILQTEHIDLDKLGLKSVEA